MSKNTYFRIAGISATLAAVLISIADYLLEFSPEYGVSSQIIEPGWQFMKSWRFPASIYLCAFMIPFYLGGFWLLYENLKTSHKKTAAIICLLFSYGVVMGSPLIHTLMSINPVIYKFGIENNIDMENINYLIESKLTGIIFPVFAVHYLLTWVIAPALLFGLIIRGKTSFSRWTAFLNPLVFLIVGMLALQIYPEIFKYLAPGSINKGNACLFFLLTWKSWNLNLK